MILPAEGYLLRIFIGEAIRKASSIRVIEVSTIRVSGWDKEPFKSRSDLLIPFADANGTDASSYADLSTSYFSVLKGLNPRFK